MLKPFKHLLLNISELLFVLCAVVVTSDGCTTFPAGKGSFVLIFCAINHSVVLLTSQSSSMWI